MPEEVPSIAIVVSRYNGSITGALLAGAREAYAQAGGDRRRLSVIEAPGAWELTAVCASAARSGCFAGVVALGCVIAGETRHDRYINEAVAEGLTRITLETGTPISFGLLTVENEDQARERAGGSKGNKGADAMVAVLETIHADRAINRWKSEANGSRAEKPLVHRLGVTPADKAGGDS